VYKLVSSAPSVCERRLFSAIIAVLQNCEEQVNTMQRDFRFMYRLTAIIAVIASVAFSLVAQTREQTTIQTVSLDVKDKKAAITVKYLDLPWGEKTFTYIEKGDDNYYGNRSWPFARLITTVPVKLEDHNLAAGNYALVINPAKKAQPMAITVVQISGDAEFLQPGNIFVEVPTGKTIFSAPAVFDTGDKVLADHMKVTLGQADSGANLTVLYGNRKLNRLLVVAQ